MSTNIKRLVEIMALLRDPDKGCPWDVEQTFATIAHHTIEEAQLFIEAVHRCYNRVLEQAALPAAGPAR